jgi:hypothetical protein
MKKLTQKKIVDVLVQSTIEYTDAYFAKFGGNNLDKKLWGALHVGFLSGLKACGYEEKFIMDCLLSAQTKISELENSNNPQA